MILLEILGLRINKINSMLRMKLNEAFIEFEWVMKILNSVENKIQLDVASKCFDLWEMKHITEDVSPCDDKMIHLLRGRFWSMFNNKEIKFNSNITE